MSSKHKTKKVIEDNIVVHESYGKSSAAPRAVADLEVISGEYELDSCIAIMKSKKGWQRLNMYIDSHDVYVPHEENLTKD